MAKVIMKAIGMDGQVYLMTDRVVIKREGIWNMFKYGMNATREIPLGAISEVAFRAANVLRFGEIEFVRSGRSTDEKKKTNSNAVRFNKKASPQFEALKEKVFDMVNQQSRPK